MRIHFGRRLLAPAIILVTIVLTAYTAAPAVTPVPEVTPVPTTQGEKSVTLLWPLNGSVLPNPGNMIVFVEVYNFKLVDNAGRPNVEGEGHILYFMDKEAPIVPGVPALTDAGTYAASADISYTWHDIACGQHTFSVELVNNDNTPLTTPAVAKSAVALHAPE